MTMDERPAGAPTLDRRIERLERDFATFTTDVALIKAEQGHIRELITAKFAEGSAATARIEGTLATVVQLVQSSTTDAAASPMGRSLRSDIADARGIAEAAKAIADRVDRRQILFTGALGVIVWVAGIVGPLIARMIFGAGV